MVLHGKRPLQPVTDSSAQRTPRPKAAKAATHTPPPLPVMTADERKLATFTFEALKKTGVFSQTAVGGVFQGVPPLDLTSTAQTAALEHMCRRLAMARRRTTTPSPEAAQTYNERIGALWKKHGKELGCAISFPGNGFLGETVEGASVSTWARRGNTQVVGTQEEFAAGEAADAYHQTVHAVMPREGDVLTLSLTICISLCAFAMLNLVAPLMQVDGHAVNNLNRESKDGKGHLVQPSELARDECYTVAFDLLLHGRVAFLIVDGASGRAALVAYILAHGGFASPLSQAALRHLGLALCLVTALSATNGGSIFLLYIHDYMTIVFLRPSIGSYAFLEYRRHGWHGLMVALMVVHNQMVLLGFLMGIHLDTFIHDESPLPLIFDTKYQQQITDCLHKLGYLHPSHVYRTPMSNGGHMSVALAGEYSEQLGRNSLTMPERGERSAALAGTWSEELGRDRATAEERGQATTALAGKFSEKLGRKRMTMSEMAHASAALAGEFSKPLGRNRAIAGEVTTDTLVIFSHRPSTDYDWSAWQGSRYLRLGGGLDGISPSMLGGLLAAVSSQQDAIAGCAGVTSILKQFPVQALAGTTRASPLTCLNGRLQVAMADAYPATPPGTVLQRAPTPTLRRAPPPMPPPPARHEVPSKRATPVPPRSGPPPPKAVAAGGAGAAKKSSKPTGQLSWNPINQLSFKGRL